MRKLEDKSLDSARKKFYSSIVLLIIAIIYLISPIDLIPDVPPVGFVDDILLLMVSTLYSGYSYHKLKRERENLQKG